MNKEGPGSSIEWTTFSWNPVTGCKFGCPYCYARGIAKRFRNNFPDGFEPRFIPERLSQPGQIKKPSRIFVCSMGDLFGSWVPKEWVTAVLDVVRDTPQHIFQFLTKEPTRLPEFSPYPSNAWIGASVDYKRRLRPTLDAMQNVDATIRWVSFEPLLESVGIEDLDPLEWVVIGGQTGRGSCQPDDEWIDELLISAGDRPVFFKENITQYPVSRRRYELPAVAARGQTELFAQ